MLQKVTCKGKSDSLKGVFYNNNDRTKDNLKEDFTILSSFHIRFCHFRVLKIEEIAGRKLRLAKRTSKYLKIP